MSKAEERAAARDYVMARLAACRGALASAQVQLDDALWMFIAPDEDAKGAGRRDLLESIDAAIGEAARAVQLAQPVLEDIDPKEGEPEPDEDDEDDDEDEDD